MLICLITQFIVCYCGMLEATRAYGTDGVIFGILFAPLLGTVALIFCSISSFFDDPKSTWVLIGFVYFVGILGGVIGVYA